MIKMRDKKKRIQEKYKEINKQREKKRDRAKH